MSQPEGKILALDIGAARIGLALADARIRLAQPSGIVRNDAHAAAELQALCVREGVVQLVAGLPRGMDGQETRQTDTVRVVGTQLSRTLGLPLAWQDEAATSLQAEAELQARGKPYAKADIDALAATYILEDYLNEHVQA